MAARSTRITAVGLGVLLGIPATLLATPGLILFVSWLRQDSPSTHARKVVQALFDGGSTRSARVERCTQIGADSEARIYRCRIDAQDCTRTFGFAVYRE